MNPLRGPRRFILEALLNSRPVRPVFARGRERRNSGRNTAAPRNAKDETLRGALTSSLKGDARGKRGVLVRKRELTALASSVDSWGESLRSRENSIRFSVKVAAAQRALGKSKTNGRRESRGGSTAPSDGRRAVVRMRLA